MLKKFLQESTGRDRGCLTSAILKNSKYRPDLQSEYSAVANPELPVHINYYLISNDLKEPPKCECCSNTSAFIDFDSGFKRWCSQKCYTSTLSENNPAARKVVIEGKEYSTIKEAVSVENISRHKIKRAARAGEIECYEDSFNRLSNIHPILLDFAYLSAKKNSRYSIRDIAKELLVKECYVSDAFLYHRLSTKYDQISPEAKTFLNDKTALEKVVAEDTGFVDALRKYSITGPTLLKAIEKFDLEYIRKVKSIEEERIRQMVISWGFDTKKARILDGKEIDIYIESLNIGIEYNGVYYHKESETRTAKYHQEKFLIAKSKGIRLIQIWEDDWLSDKRDLIVKKLKHVLGISDADKIYARKCIARTASNAEVKQFYIANHIQGHKISSEVFVLEYDGTTVAAASFNKSKLERFATSSTIVGGFSKLMKFTGKDKITTYADLCWSDSDNNVYTKNGFVLTKITQPGYFWLVKGKRVRREKFQKKNLVGMPYYEEYLSEREIMEKNGHFRIFDAGHVYLEFNK